MVPNQDPYAINTYDIVADFVADFEISRQSLPSGTKGFEGTEGFMVPEIIKYNVEEEYTEKVDWFSLGIFIYELITIHQPFENHESVKESSLEGHQPALTYRFSAFCEPIPKIQEDTQIYDGFMMEDTDFQLRITIISV